METKSKLKIFVACHKPCQVPSDDVYTPIQVGRAISSQRLDMIGDDTGDNISQKNATYCEMTAHYWVWKNVKDAEYVGVCHYRRFFDIDLSLSQEALINGADVILSAPHYRLQKNYFQNLLYICSDDFAILRASIRKLCPEYEATFDRYLVQTEDYPYNMLICRKELFDNYAKWIFSLLFECESRMRMSPYSRGRRVFGYIAEIMTPVYFIKNGYTIRHIETSYIDGDNIYVHSTPMKTKLKGKVKNFISKVRNEQPYLYDYAHVIALKNDGIAVDELL